MMKVKLLTMNKLQHILTMFLFFLMAQNVFAQSVEITGTIVDSEDQMPLPGVNILEKGTNNGSSTDFDGDYRFNVSSANAVLVISFMGYKTQEVALNGRTNVNIKLVTDQQQLDEVVLVGFGTVKKSDLTGAVATISGEELKKQPISNVAEALTGRLAGVKVTSSEGSPDSEINIRIRGGGSLTQDASPLFIVDGFPVSTISDISPNDIESVTVLKDASSTAIYGSRGANGVILITTKSGVTGDKVSVSYDMFVGFSKIAKTIDVLNVQDFVKWQYEFALLDNDLNSFTEPLGSFEDIGQYNGISGRDWQREIYGRTGQIQSHNIGIRGSSDTTTRNN
jgi:TonB-linked SusC/RagA family outer membrane protein